MDSVWPQRKWTLAVPVALFVVYGAGACTSEAVGVDECKRIEEARCRAAHGCDLGLDTSNKVDECILFSDDNCLHGLPAKQTPKAADVDHCVAAIGAASQCVTTHPLAKDCSPLAMPTAGTTTVCDVIQNPELAPSCAFLLGEPTPVGTGGSTGDAASD